METRKYELPVTKKVVELKPYITGRDSEYIQEPILSSMDMSFDARAKNVSTGKMDGKAVQEMQRRELQSYLVALDDNRDNLLDRVLDLPQPDYDFVKERIEDIKAGDEKKGEAETQS